MAKIKLHVTVTQQVQKPEYAINKDISYDQTLLWIPVAVLTLEGAEV
jgi:hypothetical protein